MQSRKQFTMILCLVLTFMLISCSNTYNNLVPNDKQNIMEFSLSSEDHKTRSVSSEIKENYITVKVPKGTDITRLFPKAVLPKQATLFPLTLKYLQEAFPRTDVLDMALRINPAKKGLENWFLTLYEENPDFSIPPLVFPINFFYPVTFAVIGGQGGVEIYTVKVIYDDGSEPDIGDLPDPNLDESKKILSFYVPDKQKGSSTITHDTIDFMLKAGTDLRAILPEITTEPESVAIPLTREYLFEASSKLGLDPLTFAQGYINSADKRAFIKGAIASSDTSNLSLAIDKIIDFTNPIQIVVLGTLSKSVRVYTVTASLDKDEAYLKRIVFTKVKNPALIKDYIGEVFQEQKEVSCTLYYPYEYGASGDEKVFNLILDSQYTGSNLTIEYNGKEYSLNDEVPFKPIKMGNELYYLGNARAKVHVDNGTVRKTYKLKLTFKEDPDTIRSITDFRFETFYNSKIKATSIANIVNRDDEGEIKAEVLYSGEKPNKLIPSFITGGGKVLVGGKEQISKSSKQDFSSPINYVCVSKDGNYERVYTIKVEFIKVESPEVVLKSFKFPLHLNKEISQDAVGIIDEAHSTVSVDVVYDGTEKPFELVSEFSATGAVSIEGITQSSGFSTQNYKYDVYLKVTALDDENVSKTYRVHVTFNYSTQNKCQLLRFYFEKEKNPTLKETVEGYISSSSYNVYAVVPKECDETQLVPSFEAEGVVKVAGVVQTSGVSSQDFTNIVEYVVVSENGQNSKTYKVKVQKQGDIIYLDPHARGKNNGSTWKDAFRKLEDAIEAANNASDENVEIWITKTDYLEWSFDGVRNLKLNKTISIRGGFLGTETNKDERKEWGNTCFRDVNFGRSKNAPIKWAFVFDRINFYGDVRLFDFNYDDERLFKDNSITFDNCFFDISVVNIPFGTQCLIKNSKSSERPTLQIDSKLSQGYSGVELIIEDSNLNCKKFELDGTSPLIKLKVLNSKINSTFSDIVAKDIEFENVEIKGVDGIFSLGHAKKQSRFKNVKTDGRLIFTGFVYGKNNDGEYLFENCSINDIRFSHLSTQYTRLAKDIKFKNCNINKFIVGTGNEDDYSFPLVDSIIIEGLNAENNDKNDFMAFGAKNVKIRDSNFHGNILINVNLSDRDYPHDESQRYTFLEIKNSNVIKLVAGYMKIKKYSNETPEYNERSHGLIVLGDSKFDDILIAGGDEISLKHLSIKNGIGLYNEKIENSKIELNDVNVSDSNGGIIDCRAKNIFAHYIQGFKENLFYGKENVVLEKSSFGNYLDRLTLVGNNVRIKDVKIDKNIEVDKNIEALVNIVALENFEFDFDKTSKYTTALYYPKAYNVQSKIFSNLKLLRNFKYDDSLRFPDVSGAFTFNNCKFYNSFRNERKDTVIDSCEFIGDNTVFNTGSLKIENIEKKIGTLEVDTAYNSTISISHSNFEKTTFGATRNTYYGRIIIESSTFRNIKKFSQRDLIFDISNSTFEIDGAMLDTDVWFTAYDLDIKNSTFEKKYPYIEHTKGIILLNVYASLKLKNTKFINTKDMCNACIRMNSWSNEARIEGCTFVDSGRIYIGFYKNILIKDSIIHGVMLDLAVMSNEKNNNFSSSSQTLFENCDFFNPDKPSTIYLGNYMSKTHGGVDYVHWGPVAVKFEYDMSKIPNDLRSKISDSPTPQKIAQVLKPFITGSTNRVGYFINLGNDEPSNSHPAKFLGNYN